MGFKDPHLKKHKNKQQSENITIDAKHNEMIKYFQNLQKSIPDKKKELKSLHDQFTTMNNVEHNDFDMEFILFKDSVEEKIQIMEKELQDIIDKKEEKNYYLNVGTLLIDYYDNLEHSKIKQNHIQPAYEFLISNDNHSLDDDEFDDDYDIDNESDDEEEDIEEVKPVKKKNVISKPTKNILDFFQGGNEEEENTEEIKEEITEDIEEELSTKNKKEEINFASMKMSDFVKQESKFKKKNILEEYLQIVDPNYIPAIKFDIKQFFCKKCDYEMTLYPTDGIQICEKCGMQENILIESDKPSFKDCNGDNISTLFNYKRSNHFSEWLSQFQARETTEIPDEVYEKILIEIKKERITNLESLTTLKIRQFLKKIKCNKYYDHAAYILYQINGVPPPTINKELEEKLKLMFKEIQGPFIEVCPRKVRKNFLNYSYVLHKFVELLGLDEYKKYFPLLKDRQKLHDTDMIWKKICEKLNWEFYKSI
jgi:hypothetical protein